MRKLSISILSALFIMLCTQTSTAQGIKVGAGLMYGSEIEEIGLQINGVVDLPVTSLRAAADVGFFFVEDAEIFGTTIETSVWEANVNAHYVFDFVPKANVYALAGLNFTTVSVDVGGTSDSETDTGLNLGAGAELPLGPVDFFAEAKLLFSDAYVDSQLALTGGVRIGFGK